MNTKLKLLIHQRAVKVSSAVKTDLMLVKEYREFLPY